jgi:hypothetical protein
MSAFGGKTNIARERNDRWKRQTADPHRSVGHAPCLLFSTDQGGDVSGDGDHATGYHQTNGPILGSAGHEKFTNWAPVLHQIVIRKYQTTKQMANKQIANKQIANKQIASKQITEKI